MRAVLWDFDGTLVDTEPIWMEVEDALVSEHGGKLPAEVRHSLIGVDARVTGQILADLIPDSGLTPGKVTAEIRRRVDEVVATRPLPWKPGAGELLGALKEAGLATALVSASHRGVLDSAVARMPEGSFDIVISSDDVTRHKPDPEGYLAAMAALGVSPDDVVVIEDSVPGTTAANASGAVVIAVPDQVSVDSAPRRVIVESLVDLDVEKVRAIWEELSHE